MTKALNFAQKMFLPFCILMFFASCVTLFYSAERVEALREQLRTLDYEIAQEQENYRVLTAEWTYLNTPERLMSMTEQHLRLRPKSPKQLVQWDVVPQRQQLLHDASVSAEGIEWSNFEASDYLARNDTLQKSNHLGDLALEKKEAQGVSLKDLWSEKAE